MSCWGLWSVIWTGLAESSCWWKSNYNSSIPHSPHLWWRDQHGVHHVDAASARHLLLTNRPPFITQQLLMWPPSNLRFSNYWVCSSPKIRIWRYEFVHGVCSSEMGGFPIRDCHLGMFLGNGQILLHMKMLIIICQSQSLHHECWLKEIRKEQRIVTKAAVGASMSIWKHPGWLNLTLAINNDGSSNMRQAMSNCQWWFMANPG